MTLNKNKKITNLLRIIADIIDKDEHAIEDIERILSKYKNKSKKKIVKYEKIDLFDILSNKGKKSLHEELSKLEIDHLKAILKEHSLDSSNIAKKWKNKEKLIKFIVTRIDDVSTRGKVFSAR